MEDKKEMILLNIKIYEQEKGYAPSIRDICKLTNINSTATVHRFLKQLEEDRRIRITKGVARGIIILD